MDSIEALRAVWTKHIAADYAAGVINRERPFQACSYYHLRNQIGPDRVFVESAQREESLGGQVPDILLASPSSEGSGPEHVDLWLALKFIPWYQGDKDHFQDLQKVESIMMATDNQGELPIHIRLNPQTGDFCPKPDYVLDAGTQYAFAIVARGENAGRLRQYVSEMVTCAHRRRLWLLWAWADGRMPPRFEIQRADSLVTS